MPAKRKGVARAPAKKAAKAKSAPSSTLALQAKEDEFCAAMPIEDNQEPLPDGEVESHGDGEITSAAKRVKSMKYKVGRYFTAKRKHIDKERLKPAVGKTTKLHMDKYIEEGIKNMKPTEKYLLSRFWIFLPSSISSRFSLTASQ